MTPTNTRTNTPTPTPSNGTTRYYYGAYKYNCGNCVTLLTYELIFSYSPLTVGNYYYDPISKFVFKINADGRQGSYFLNFSGTGSPTCPSCP